MKIYKSVERNIKEEKFGYKEYDENGKLKLSKNVSHSAALSMGFRIDVENDVYVLDDFGAFVFNVSSNIQSMQDINNAYDEVLKCNPFHKILDLQKQGYEFCLGPSFPLHRGNKSEYFVGLYCSNYENMVQKEAEIVQSI